MLAKRMNLINSKSIRDAFKLAASLKNPIDLSVGYPTEDTPEIIKSAGIKAISENLTRYTPANGIPKLRAAIEHKLLRENHIDYRIKVTVTPGLTTAILLAYLSLLDEDDEVIVPDPYFPPYRDLAALIGAKPVLMDTYPHFQVTAEKLEKLITPKTKIIVINSPNNPSGSIYPEAELRRIAEVARRHGIVIISDEIYEYYSYERPHFSIGSIYDNTLTFNGFSKAYAMTGWRIGYIAGPEQIIEAINELQQYIVFSSSSIGQHAALQALSTIPNELITAYRHKHALTKNSLSPLSNIQGMHGAFYCFIKTPSNTNDLSVMESLMRRNVIILPGRVFSNQDSHIRIAFIQEEAKLKAGLQIINDVFNEYMSGESDTKLN